MYRGTNYSNGGPKYLATFTIEKRLLWSFDSPGLFSFLGDWFGGSNFAAHLDGCNDCTINDVFIFLTEWFNHTSE
jgi:hypothetical protein